MIVDRPVATILGTDLALEPQQMASWCRRAGDANLAWLVQHSDRSGQHRAVRCAQRPAEADVGASSGVK